MLDMTYEYGLSILKSALSKTRGILREPTLFLYIAHAYYEGWLERDNKWTPFSDSEDNYKPLEHLVEFINSSKSDDVAFLRRGFDAIIDAYKDNPVAFSDLYELLRDIPIVWFEQAWPDEPKEQYWSIAFDDLLTLIDQSLGKESTDFSQPKELVSLIRFLKRFFQTDDDEHTTVYDPFAGIGRFLDPGNENCFYQEINQDIYALARIRTLAQTYSPVATRDYVCADSTKNWAQNTQGIKSFDFIVSFPPMSLRVPVTPEMEIDWPASKISLEDFLINKGCNSLNWGGCLIGFFSNSILCAEGATGAQRKRLVKDKRVRMVIQLPANLLPGTGVSTCLVVFSDKYTRNDEILFLDASSLFVKGKRRNILSTDTIFQILSQAYSKDYSANEHAKHVARVSVSDVIANDCILAPVRYLSSAEHGSLVIPEGFEAVPLEKLVTVSRGVSTSESEVRLVRGKDLSSTGIIDYQSFERLELEVAPSRAMVIKEDSVFVLRVGNLKATLFRPTSGVSVALTSNVSALIPNNGVDPFYLVSELRKPYVAEQVTFLSQGSVIPYLKTRDLLSILVLLPIERSLQHQVFLNTQRINEEQRIKELKVDEYIRQERNRLGEMMSIRRHRINPYISGLRSNVAMLLDEMFAEGRLEADSELSANYTVQDALENMEENLIQLKNLFDAFTVDTSVGTVETVDLIPFLKQYSFTHTMPDRQFELDKSLLGSTDRFPHIVFNHGNLSEILDEIIHNAEKHFAPNTPGFSVMFVPRFDGKDVSLLICNNGEPVPADFDEERSFVAGYHKDANGTGQGLFRVRQVCDEFGATVAWENDSNNLMPTGLCITFKRSSD